MQTERDAITDELHEVADHASLLIGKVERVRSRMRAADWPTDTAADRVLRRAISELIRRLCFVALLARCAANDAQPRSAR